MFGSTDEAVSHPQHATANDLRIQEGAPPPPPSGDPASEAERMLSIRSQELQDLKHRLELSQQEVEMATRRAEGAERLMRELKDKVDEQLVRVEHERQEMAASIAAAKQELEHERAAAKKFEDACHRRANELADSRKQTELVQLHLSNLEFLVRNVYAVPIDQPSFLHTIARLTTVVIAKDDAILADAIQAIRAAALRAARENIHLLFWFGIVAHIAQTIQRTDAYADTIGNLAVDGLHLKPLPPSFELPVACLTKTPETPVVPSYTGLEKTCVDLLHEIFGLLHRNLVRVRSIAVQWMGALASID